MTAPARTAAFRALVAIASNHRDLPTALVESRRNLTDERDRSLAAAIVQGTLRWQRACDYLIERVSARSLASLDQEVLVILRLSLYQILHLDRVPSAAVVDDAVSLTRAAAKKSAAGFVNAVLRSTLRQRRSLPLPSRPDDPGNRDAALLYLGVALVASGLARGAVARSPWLRADREVGAVQQRAGASDTERQPAARDSRRGAEGARGREYRVREHGFAPHGLRVVTGNPLRQPSHEQFLVQDEASQLVPLAVDAHPAERMLDLCAAPGGKTVMMSGDMHDTGVLVACDVRARRVALLRDTDSPGGCASCLPDARPGGGALPFTPDFDRVLVDAPCSGLGTVRRDPDIKWRRHEDELAGLAERQVDIAPSRGHRPQTGRTAGVRDVLERARRERNGRRAISRRGVRLSTARSST